MQTRRRAWILGPWFDLGVVSFGWVPLLVGYLYARAAFGEGFSCDVMTRDDCPLDVQQLIALTVFITGVHRHYGLALVYGDSTEFHRHRAIYSWAPLVLALAVIPACLYRFVPEGVARTALYAIYTLVSSVSGLWNVYHVVMQKFGFLRIYSSKLGHGEARVDRLLFFSWLALVIVGGAHSYSNEFFYYLDGRGFEWAAQLAPLLDWGSLILAVPVAAFAGYFTYRWIAIERRHYSRASQPRLIFALSMALVLLTFAHSLLLGFMLLGFSHALEYSVFASVYARRKYRNPGPEPELVSFAARWPLLSNLVLGLAIFGLYRLLRSEPALGLVTAYGLYSSMLHFLYDGLIWKMSNPETRLIILDL